MKRKIRVLLGGYVNSIQAQDLNCRALAMFLDKDKFDVSAFLVPQEFRDFEIGDEMAGVNLIQLNRPAKILWYWIYLKGLLNCDVAYLPKGQKRHWCRFLCKLLGKKSFMTVEGVMNENNYKHLIDVYGSVKKVRELYNNHDRTYSITRHMAVENERIMGIKSEGVLYLGVDSNLFHIPNRQHDKGLTDLIFIGSNLRHKHIEEYLKLSTMFASLTFHIAGGYPEFAEEFNISQYPNVVYHGRLNHQDLAALLAKVDLHVFTSRSEGFPKVTLETAAAGVPSIVYSDYGASEWINSGENGYVVERFEEIVNILNDLKSNPDKLRSLSENAISMAARFDWKSVVKDWEAVIEDLYMSDKK